MTYFRLHKIYLVFREHQGRIVSLWWALALWIIFNTMFTMEGSVFEPTERDLVREVDETLWIFHGENSSEV